MLGQIIPYSAVYLRLALLTEDHLVVMAFCRLWERLLALGLILYYQALWVREDVDFLAKAIPLEA